MEIVSIKVARGNEPITAEAEAGDVAIHMTAAKSLTANNIPDGWEYTEYKQTRGSQSFYQLTRTITETGTVGPVLPPTAVASANNRVHALVVVRGCAPEAATHRDYRDTSNRPGADGFPMLRFLAIEDLFGKFNLEPSDAVKVYSDGTKGTSLAVWYGVLHGVPLSGPSGAIPSYWASLSLHLSEGKPPVIELGPEVMVPDFDLVEPERYEEPGLVELAQGWGIAQDMRGRPVDFHLVQHRVV